jgi:hypothetical protein
MENSLWLLNITLGPLGGNYKSSDGQMWDQYRVPLTIRATAKSDQVGTKQS